MTIALALGGLGAPLAALLIAVSRTVRGDGLGTRPGPRSHRTWDDGLRP